MRWHFLLRAPDPDDTGGASAQPDEPSAPPDGPASPAVVDRPPVQSPRELELERRVSELERDNQNLRTVMEEESRRRRPAAPARQKHWSDDL